MKAKSGRVSELKIWAGGGMLKKPVMITGLHEILSQDYSIEELYWGTCFGESCRPGRFLVLNSFCSS